MKKPLIVLGAVSVAIVFALLTGCGNSGPAGGGNAGGAGGGESGVVQPSNPSTAIIADINGLNDLLDKNFEKPDECFEKVRGYLRDHLPDFARNVALIATELDKVRGQGDREKRMKEIMDELTPALKSLSNTFHKVDKHSKEHPQLKTLTKEWGKSWDGAGSAFEKGLPQSGATGGNGGAGGSNATLSSKQTTAINSDFNGLSEILEKNIDQPDELFGKLRIYLGDHLPEFARNVAIVVIELDNIKAPGDRQKRMKEIMDELTPALKRFKKVFDNMDKRSQENPKLKTAVEEWQKGWNETAKAFDKTMEMIFSDTAEKS